LREKYLEGGIGTYTRAYDSSTWTKVITSPATPTTGVKISFWVNEDNQILYSDNNVKISKSGNQSLFATVSTTYTNIQWYLQGKPFSNEKFLSIHAVDYAPGIYRLGIIVYKGSVPYSTEIRFTVTN